MQKEGSVVRQTIIAMMEDKPGALNQVVSLFRRRKCNIESLAVGKLINVIEVTNVTDEPSVDRELALIKVSASSSARYKITQLVDIFRARVIDVATESLTVEITGTEDKIESLIELLRPFGIKEMVRTGRVAMLRGETVAANVSMPTYSVAQPA